MLERHARMRHKPLQKRAQETVELILKTTALLLEEVGFDKLNTNLICERAGLTPPALYRYFPNKYAVVEELGFQLMEAQNVVAFTVLEGTPRENLTPAAIADNLRRQFEVTKEFPAAQWVLSSLRAVPAFAKIRLESHARMIRELVDWYIKFNPDADVELLTRRVQIINECGYAVLEMLLEKPELNVDETFDELALMITSLPLINQDTK